MAAVEPWVLGDGVLERIETFPHRPVADGVHVDAEPFTCQQRGHLAELCGFDEGLPAAGVVAGHGAVRSQHRGRAVFADAVLHDLHHARREPCVPGQLAARTQVADLPDTPIGLPPQCADDAGGQLTCLVGVDVGGEVVLQSEEFGADRGILPAGDADGVQSALRFEQRTTHELRCHRRDEVVDGVAAAVQQHSGGLAGLLANDPPAGGIRSVRGDSGPSERARVHPRAVIVVAGHDDRPVGDHRVDVVAGGKAVGERVAVPAGTGDHRVLRVARRVVGDGGQIGPAIVGKAREVAAQGGHARRHRMRVRVDEPRQ